VKKILIITSILILLSGCTEEKNIEQAIRTKLNDPNSAQFKDLIKNGDGSTACITWNSKNSTGGYSKWAQAELSKDGSDWKVINLNTNPKRCTSEAFTAREKIADAQSNAYAEATEILKSSLNPSRTSAEELAKIEECKLIIFVYSRFAKALITNTANGTRDQHAETQYKELKSKLKSGDCNIS
jgi:hypothetical protein